MQNVKQQLLDVGLPCTLTVRETGQTLVLNFAKGQRSKAVHVVLGSVAFDAKLALADNKGPDESPNLVLVLAPANVPDSDFGSAPSVAAPVPVEQKSAAAAPPPPPVTVTPPPPPPVTVTPPAPTTPVVETPPASEESSVKTAVTEATIPVEEPTSSETPVSRPTDHKKGRR